jgi:hypothetical protein
MNKLFMLIAGILLMGIVINGGETIINTLTIKDIDITYPTIKDDVSNYTKPQMMNFNDVKYEVRGNTIILNKKNLFQNREVPLIEEQTCTTWNAETCKEFSQAECLSWSEPSCVLWEERKPIQCLKIENPEMPFDLEKNPCLEWEQPKDCLEFDAKIGECLKWETEMPCLEYSKPECTEYSIPQCLSWNPKTCSTWTKYTREDFIQMAIKKEIEMIKGIQIARANKVITDINATGKIQIK